MPVTILKSHRLKATKQRLELLTLLRKQHRPRTAEQLQAQLENVSTATVYRMMDDFLRAGLVNRVDLGHGHTHFEYADPNHHHHHLVCEQCGRIQDIVIPPGERLIRTLAARHHFQIQRHSMEFFGLCRRCQTK